MAGDSVLPVATVQAAGRPTTPSPRPKGIGKSARGPPGGSSGGMARSPVMWKAQTIRGVAGTGSHSADRRECAHAPLPARSASSGPATAGADRQAAGAGPGAAWSSDGGATASAVAFTPGSSAAIAISAADDVPRATVGFAASSATSSATAAAASARSATSRRTVWRDASATAPPPRGGVAAAEPSRGLRRCEGPDRPAQAPIGPDCQRKEAARASPRRGAHADSIAARRRPQGAARWHGDGTHWRTAVGAAAPDVQAVFRRPWIH